MKIEDSEDEEKEIVKKEKKEEDKKLIYDNSYLFPKDKKEKNIAIKKEVLEILNSEQNLTRNNNENKKMNSNYNISDINRRRKSSILNSIINSRRASKINFNHLRKLKPKNTPFDKYKISLFNDIKEEKIEKVEDEKEKTLNEKLEIFFKEIQRMKKNGINVDYSDFLKMHETKEKEKEGRLIDFMVNINNFRDKAKYHKTNWNFLSPIQFKTNNFLNPNEYSFSN